MLKRLCNPLLSRSFFLFGARGTGKTTLIKELIPEEARVIIDLLLPSQFDRYALDPESLVAMASALPSGKKWIVIDEVQKLPRLLDVVHHLSNETPIRFALTGSSARKLKRKGVNLLAGRASVYNLHPLTQKELGANFSLQEALEWGTLPESITNPDTQARLEFLEAYAYTYLKEEIAQEQAVRGLEPFRRFLAVAAQSSGKILNFKKISDDCGVSSVTVKSYFQVLEDTLLGFFLEAFHESVRKSQRQHPKFYFFDRGVERALAKSLNVTLNEQSYAFGIAFESFFINEVFRLLSYGRKQSSLSYLRTKDGAEIDLILDLPNKRTLIEIKSSTLVREKDTTQLAKLAQAISHDRALLVSRDTVPKKFGEVLALPWNEALSQIVED